MMEKAFRNYVAKKEASRKLSEIVRKAFKKDMKKIAFKMQYKQFMRTRIN